MGHWPDNTFTRRCVTRTCKKSRENKQWRDLPLLVLSAFLASTSYTSTSEGVVWPMSHAVLPPELRGSSRAVINVAIGALSALALSISGIVADLRGVSTALLWFVPGLILLSAIAWIPMFRAYPKDREALHKNLEQRRKELLG